MRTTLRIVRSISEDEMIAVFLRGELDSERYGARLRELAGAEAEALLDPDTADAEVNRRRRETLDRHRAYERRQGLFLGFPDDVDWYRAVLTPDEVLDIRYIDWDWWLRLSGGSRRPRDAARRIRAAEIEGVGVEEHEALAASQHPLIAVATRAGEPLVLVEGHARLTAYALFPERLPTEVEILLGLSDAVRGWCQY